MKYENMTEGQFVSRPNRFIAQVMIDGKEETVHVKNTGRCKELLIPGVTVYLQEHDNPNRKTKFSLIGVKKGDTLINMDSQAPNKVVEEWINAGGIYKDLTYIKREQTYGSSRFDMYIEGDGKKAYVEVKGVTLEVDGVARFPDAPTERGIKHMEELISCQRDGFEAYLIFVIQMKGVHRFEPNDVTHKAFGDTLKKAAEAGVHIKAVDCIVTKDELVIDQDVEVSLGK